MKNTMTICTFAILISLVLGCCLGQRDEVEFSPRFESSVAKFTILQEKGGRTSWSHATNTIAFDRKGKDGYFDIYVMRLDGSDVKCLTCDKDVPQLHNGNPAWHPSGEYIVFQAQDPSLHGLQVAEELQEYLTSPGIGVNNNLWVMSADGSKFWQLTHVKEHYGALHPHFSPDGTTLLWSEIDSPKFDKMGYWIIKLADFVIEGGELALKNIQTFKPGDLQLYEMHEFSPDGQRILFSGVEEGEYYYDMEIYIMDLTTEELFRLTDNDEWDEHAHFALDGHSIIWVSSEGIPQSKGDSLGSILNNPPIFEYWIMNEDGSDKRRLSGFNHKDASEYLVIEGGCGLGDFDVGPDGKTIAAKMRRGLKQELTALVEFDLDEKDKAVSLLRSILEEFFHKIEQLVFSFLCLET